MKKSGEDMNTATRTSEKTMDTSRRSDHVPNSGTLAAVKEGERLLGRLKSGDAKPQTKEDFFKGLGLHVNT